MHVCGRWAGADRSAYTRVVPGDDQRTDLVAISQRWWDEILRDGDLDVITEVFTDPFVRHTGSGTVHETHREYISRIGELLRVITRAETVVDDRVVTDDRVWTRATSRGINRETGEQSIVTWLIVQRFEGERIAEQWVATLTGVDWTT